MGDWEGRALVLLPVTWIDNWPILGDPRPGRNRPHGLASAQTHPRLTPHPPHIRGYFHPATPKPEWEWNYQPRPAMWSLSERPGHLRLHAFPSLKETFQTTANILTQRSMRVPFAQVTVRLDLSGMAPGQRSGLAHFSKTYATIAVRQNTSSRTILVDTNGVTTDGPIVTTSTLWLRSTWGLDGLNQFAFSTNGKAFTNLGSPTP